MTVYVPQLNKDGFGGGNTFIRNFRKYTRHELTDHRESGDMMFVANPMWADRADFMYYDGKRKVLRLDNIPEDWNNRGTAISKLRDFVKMASQTIYQSEWSREKYLEFGAKDGEVIHNGVDLDIYKPEGESINDPNHPRILYVKSSRNENKRYPEAMEIFRRYWQKNKNAKLYLVGQFADDIRTYNFGFYNGENYQYFGVMKPEMMAMLYRSSDVLLFPAFADCAPNVVLEAMACGVTPIIHPYGGAPEYTNKTEYAEYMHLPYEHMIENALNLKKKEEIIEHIRNNFDAADMARKYDGVLDV